MQHPEVARDKLFNLRVSAEEWQRFEALAKHYGLGVAQTLRMIAKRDADSLGIGLPAPRSSAEAMARHHARKDIERAVKTTEVPPKKPAKK